MRGVKQKGLQPGLQLAGRYRDLILLAEIGAYLHDIGKLSSFFVLSKAKGKTVKDFRE
jgi:metal-dependent HD superfamily phosphatase/phosphodiesterase